MSQTNKSVYNKNKTHEGGAACHLSPFQELQRSVLTCLLWEDGFYESGKTISNRIAGLIPKVSRAEATSVMYSAKNEYKLRHVPMFMAVEMAKHGLIGKDAVCDMITRADELAEFLSMYWKKGRCSISAQVKKGLAKAFHKFGEYNFAKYNRDKAVTLRDVMFMVHPEPLDDAEAALFGRIASDTLKTPDTWETRLSAGKDKKTSFTDLLEQGKMGYLAILRNLRNMREANVDRDLIRKALLSHPGKKKILPFRFLTAAKYAPDLEDAIEQAMLMSLGSHEKILGKTVLLVDTSGSMSQKISSKSELTGWEVAGALAILLREVCEDVQVYAFSDKLFHLRPRRGMALLDQLHNCLGYATYLGRAINAVQRTEKYDRMIVISDEQTHDSVQVKKQGASYMVNIASNENGVGYKEKGFDFHIDGFSEAVIDYIMAVEKEGFYD